MMACARGVIAPNRRVRVISTSGVGNRYRIVNAFMIARNTATLSRPIAVGYGRP
jgi:hypothetical protein